MKTHDGDEWGHDVPAGVWASYAAAEQAVAEAEAGLTIARKTLLAAIKAGAPPHPQDDGYANVHEFVADEDGIYWP